MKKLENAHYFATKNLKQRNGKDEKSIYSNFIE